MGGLNTNIIVDGVGDALSAIYYKKETISTNDDALELARGGAAAGSVVIAEKQIRGRGRRGSVWVSPPETSLTFSYVADYLTSINGGIAPSLLAGLACVRALDECGIEAKVKWPNDLLCGQKKLAGILTEVTGNHLIVGIGLNVNVESFPEDLKKVSTSLLLEKGEKQSRELVLVAVIRWLNRYLSGEEERGDVIDQLRARCALTGSAVSLKITDERIEGHVTGLGDSGELLLWTGRSTRVITHADEIRFL